MALFVAHHMIIRAKSSPCVGLCSTTYGDTICRGCFRRLDEILQWQTLSLHDKQLYYQRLSAQVKSIMIIYWSFCQAEELALKITQDYEVFEPLEGPVCVYFSLFQLLQQNHNPFLRYESYITWKTQEMPLHEFFRVISRFVYMTNENAL
jgi:predicted Fe-S protein YdhL (DUF1289 family)